eukprot:TRINITY_DN1234_c0_g1_i1.p1 TRINITY_DN1234_c0_g1~~TRINITY_DN1234_c0_g1_i1.p1  ORF type:complete len:101 (+),score=38.53 TRINITY_DN1234_c0_g1_i1:93-395(+)
MSSMYVRIKRENCTFFFSTDPTENILEIKKQLSTYDLTPEKPESIRLVHQDDVLEDDKTIGDYKIENDGVVYLLFNKDDEWEDVEDQKTAIDAVMKADEE